MLNRVRQSIRTFTAVPGRRIYQFTLLAQLRPAIDKIGGDTVLAVIVLTAVLLVTVILPAVWSAKPARRRAAFAVLDRLLPWKRR